MRRRGTSGVTLLEILIAVTLLSLLTIGMSMALRLGLFAFAHTNARLMENRRVAGAQRIIEQELKGLMPIVAPCGGGANGPAPPAVIFQGLPDTMTMVSTFSLQEAWRGRPQILQFFIIPAEKGGVRLVVNEIPYTGPMFAGTLCLGVAPDGLTHQPIPQFARPAASETTFVLADNLAYCRFRYLAPAPNLAEPGQWIPAWNQSGWPSGLRIEMAPSEPNPARLEPINITVPVYILRDPGVKYDDK